MSLKAKVHVSAGSVLVEEGHEPCQTGPELDVGKSARALGRSRTLQPFRLYTLAV